MKSWVLSPQGRLDIPGSAFDRSKPLCLDVGARIIEILKTTTLPADRAVPGLGIDGAALRIGPGLSANAKPSHLWTLTLFVSADTLSLLVDGPSPRLTCPEPPLIDVNVQRQEDASKPNRVISSVLAATAVAWALAAEAGLWANGGGGRGIRCGCDDGAGVVCTAAEARCQRELQKR